MKTEELVATPAKIYKLLQGFSPEERRNVITSTLALFGDAGPNVGTTTKQPPTHQKNQAPNSARTFFDEKQPVGKSNELAVAARYRELHEENEGHTKEELKAVLKAASRNFDSKNFLRDIDNATRRGNLFIKGAGKGVYRLSYKGQNFVDSMPIKASETAKTGDKKTKK